MNEKKNYSQEKVPKNKKIIKYSLNIIIENKT